MPRSLQREGISLLVFSAIFYVAYRYGMSFSQNTASPFWFPDAVLLCALLVTAPRRWPLYIFAALPIRLFSEVAQDIPFWFLVATFLIDSAKAIVTALALRRYVGLPLRLRNVPQFGLFMLIAVLLVPAAGAFAGAAARQLLGHSYWSAWDQWFMGDALAQLVLTPAILYWIFGAELRALLLDTKRLIEACVLTAGLLVAAYVAANTDSGSIPLQQTRFYVPIPFLFWAALRFGMFGASGSILVLAFVITQAALQNRGPFAGLPPSEAAHALQNFLLLRAVPLYLVAVVVEQRWQTERSLRESEERFRFIANAAPVMLWLVDRERRNEFCNDSWLAFTGRTLQQEHGLGWAEGVHPEDRDRLIETGRAAFNARQRIDIDYRHRRHDGEYRWVHATGVPRHAPDGEFLGYVGSISDITDRKRAEEATRALEHAQRLAVMGELTAMIAHEIRQPLSAILLSADAARNLLQRPDPPVDELMEIMSSIRQYDLRADDTIRAIRTFARNQPMQRQLLDINHTVEEVLHLLAGDAQRRRVRLLAQLAPGLPQVMGNVTQLQQVMVNIIINGMDAEADLQESSRRIVVTTRVFDATHIEVAVRDYGRGIAPAKMPLLFESFFTTGQQGMGLGLSISRSIVAGHEGRIWARNHDDGGATFHFTVPMASGTQDS